MIKEARWMDRLSFLFTLVVAVAVAAMLVTQGSLKGGVGEHPNFTWYLIRAAGIIAYILLSVSVAWGIAVTTRVVKDWSPGALSMLLHGTASWLAVAFSIFHAFLLLTDTYFHYDLSSVLIPFHGPYRPLAVGLGTLACWFALAVAASFSVKNRLGHRAWKLLHFTSYGLFGMVTVHALLSGSDADKIGFRALLGVAVLLVVVLSGYRLGKTELLPAPAKPARRSPTAG